MKYWTQQLNFAGFCATQGCGISREIFDSGLSLTPQITTLFFFIRMLFFWPRLNILIFLPILG